jgi:hypothetical protein
LCYDITWRIQFPSEAEVLARVRLAFPSFDAVQRGSCVGTLDGRVVVPTVTDRDGSPIVAGSCALAREGSALRFDANLPIAAPSGMLQMSMKCLTFGTPQNDIPAHVRLEGAAIGAPRDGKTMLHLPRFVAQLSATESEPEADWPQHGLARALAAFGAWPRLRTPIVQAGRLFGLSHLGLPEDMLVFLRDSVHSAEQLEILVILHREPERWWSAEQVAGLLGVAVDSVGLSLRRLANRRLLVQQRQMPAVFRFSPHDSHRCEATTRLIHLYALRRVTVLTAIAMGPVDDVQSFADAFLWRDDEGR